MDYTILIVLVAFGLLVLYLRTLVKTTVEKSINHQFDIKLKQFEQSFTKELHSLDREDKYQLAALEQRLEAHQKAYALARKMSLSVHSPIKDKISFQKDFIVYWDAHCLYLDRNVRDYLWNSVSLYHDYTMYWQMWKDNPDDQENKTKLNEVFNRVTGTLTIIEKAVNLSSMGKDNSLTTEDGKKITPFGIEQEKKKTKK